MAALAPVISLIAGQAPALLDSCCNVPGSLGAAAERVGLAALRRDVNVFSEDSAGGPLVTVPVFEVMSVV